MLVHRATLPVAVHEPIFHLLCAAIAHDAAGWLGSLQDTRAARTHARRWQAVFSKRMLMPSCGICSGSGCPWLSSQGLCPTCPVHPAAPYSPTFALPSPAFSLCVLQPFWGALPGLCP